MLIAGHPAGKLGVRELGGEREVMDRRWETVRDSGYEANIAEVAPFQVVDFTSCGHRLVPAASGRAEVRAHSGTRNRLSMNSTVLLQRHGPFRQMIWRQGG